MNHNKQTFRPKRQPVRWGISMIELIVSAVVLMTIMSFVTTLGLQINLVWKDIAQQRVAVCELSNQLEMLTRMSHQEAEESIGELEPSAFCSRTLHESELTGELSNDNLGTRVLLRLKWKSNHPRKPVELAGWIIASDDFDEPDGSATPDSEVQP